MKYNLNNKGFISTSVIYTLLLSFLTMLLVLIGIYSNSRLLLNKEKEHLKENLSDLTSNINEELLLYNSILTSDNELIKHNSTTYIVGLTNNNNLYFANLNWEIISIGEDNTINIILNDSSPIYLNDSIYNSNSSNSYHSNYIYKQENDNITYYSSDIKTKTETFYEDYLLPNNNFISDKEICINNSSNSCTEKASVSNGKLMYPIRLLTIEEYNYSLYNNETYLLSDEEYWTMSPGEYNLFAYVKVIGEDAEKTVTETANIRPVITLKSNLRFTGDGTLENPYMIVGAL